VPKYIIVFAVIIVVGMLGAGGFYWYTQNTSPIPQDIKKQISYIVYYPNNSSDWVVDKSTIRLETSDKVLNFVMKNGGNQVAFAEQATPDLLGDPTGYAKLLEKMQEYSSFGSVAGKVSLTRPQELKTGQVAVDNNNGTVIFATSTRDMADDEWRKIFNSLEVVK